MMHLVDQQLSRTMWFFGLFIQCPLGVATSNCPFTGIRSQQSLERKFRLAEQMALNHDLHDQLIQHHETCYRARVAGFLPQNRPAP